MLNYQRVNAICMVYVMLYVRLGGEKSITLYINGVFII
jgi:hypothetical protein